MSDEQAEPVAQDRGTRFLAQLRTLHALAERLNDLQDAAAIGEAITTELLPIIDYHSCRVYRLLPDGKTLYPIAFGGELTEYEGDTVEDLIVEVGQGLTGHVAAAKESYYSPNALEDAYAEDIPGTDDIVESMIGVPFTHGDELVGVVILSKLGADQFDEDDLRMLEVFAPHVAVAFVNAELLERERDSARRAAELLHLSQALTNVRGVDAVMQQAMTAIPSLIPCRGSMAYRQTEDGAYRLVGLGGEATTVNGGPPEAVPARVAAPMVQVEGGPFVISKEVIAQVPREFRSDEIDTDVLIAPLNWDPDNHAVLVVLAEDPERSFTEGEVALAQGIADITSLALGNAGSFEQLEESRDQLRVLDEMKTIFLEAVSHDLRTPLSTVLGIALTLHGGTVDLTSHDAKDLLDRLVANAQRLERLLADLLDLDRLMKGIVEPVRHPTDVAALAGYVVAEADYLGRHDVLIQTEPVVISLDRPKVERILENLLVNATRHTPADTPIWVKVAPMDGGVLLAVEDAGPGIPAEARDSIFEPFSQGPASNRHSPGVGIGLSLVARFAELHGGKAWVEERDGGGSSFRVWIPDGEPAPETLSEAMTRR